MPGKQKHVALFPVPWVQSATHNAWMPVVLATILTLSPLMALGEDWVYKMRPGDSLWSITAQHLKHIRYWKRLQELNGVDDPWHMLPGTEIRIPLSWVKLRPTTLVVLEVRGEVTAQSDDRGDRVPVTRGTTLSSGDFLHTGADGSVTLAVADGSRLLVGPGSDLQLERLRAYGSSNYADTHIHLMRGRAESIVTPRTGADVPRYEIRTPAATSAVRGTRYRMSAQASGEISATEVLQGLVGVTGSGVSRSVPAGFGAIAAIDSPPSEPKPLLEAPDLSTLPSRIERVPFPIALPAVAGPTAHRIQVSTDPDFRTLVFEQVMGLGTARIPDLPDGDYILRVRAVDAEGLEGHDGERRLTVDARPEAPILVSPTPGALISEERPAFHWARPANAAAYRLQVAQDSGFEALVADLTDVRTEKAIAPGTLQPGQYYWRVATRADDGEVGPWADGSMFKRMPPAPDLEQPEITNQGISFQWARGLPGDRYEFQLARDPDFQDIVHRTVVPEPDVHLDRPESGYFFIRVRTIDSAGDVGPFGTPQRVNVPPSSYWPAVLTTLLVLILAL